MIDFHVIGRLAGQAGLDLAGVARAADLTASPDLPSLTGWLERGMQAGMAYLEGERAAIRADLVRLLPGVRSVTCCALNYNAPLPYSTDLPDSTRAWISRYAWGDDYHEVMRARLEALVAALRQQVDEPFEAKVCVDTSPVLERALARLAGIGWTAKNTCTINQQLGSWLFLGEVLTTLELEPTAPAPDRCGSCTACIDACPTGAIARPRVLDSRLCISYWTIEEKGAIPAEMRPGIGRHVFGCDICQEMCAPGTAGRPSAVNRPSSRGRGCTTRRWKSWRASARTSSARCSGAAR